ncbi:MAG: hypothetical protein ACLUA8_00575 [Ligilactobacillus salivarius]
MIITGIYNCVETPSGIIDTNATITPKFKVDEVTMLKYGERIREPKQKYEKKVHKEMQIVVDSCKKRSIY